MKNRTVAGMAIALLLALFLQGCTEKIDMSARYVFKENTALEYLENHPESYSEYTALLHQVPMSRLSETTVAQILSARGHYTVFAPTNEAIHAYLDSLVVDELIPRPSWDAFTDQHKLDSIRQVIVKNSIIDSGDDDSFFDTTNFPTVNGAEIPRTNLNDLKLPVYYVGRSGDIYIHNKYRINDTNRDILVLNGVIHQIEGVIAPRNNSAAEYFQKIVDNGTEGFLVMARAIMACGLKDTLDKVRDERYEELYQTGMIPDLKSTAGILNENYQAYAPSHRLYGYTVFAETDEFWEKQDIHPHSPTLLEDLKKWILDQHQYSDEDQFTTDDDYQNPNNILYQWTTYHILPMKIPADKLTIHNNELGYSTAKLGTPTLPVYELYTTMGKRRLMKIYESKESDGIYLNRFPNLDSKRSGTNHELSCDMDKVGCRIGRDDPRADLVNMSNCNLYPIDRPLSYNDEVRTNLMRQRLRYEAHALFPELMNNSIRQNMSNDSRFKYVYIPSDEIYRYLDDMWSERGSYTIVIDYQGGNPSYNADEIKAGGLYDITVRLPPVPRRGTYELRYAILNMPYRGVCQTYFSKSLKNRVVTGIPTDMTKSIWTNDTGYERDTDDNDYNAEVDKRMRSLGYMKGCMDHGAGGDVGQAMRVNSSYSCMRMIVTRQTLSPDEEYYLTFKNVLDISKELYLDYFEWCAKEVYDNPETPEDIW